MQQKLVRFAGITGHHDPNVIAEAVIHSTTTLIPVNAADKHIHTPSSRCAASSSTAKRGVIAMKVPARSVVQAWWAGGCQALDIRCRSQGFSVCVIAANCSPTRTKCQYGSGFPATSLLRK